MAAIVLNNTGSFSPGLVKFNNIKKRPFRSHPSGDPLTFRYDPLLRTLNVILIPASFAYRNWDEIDKRFNVGLLGKGVPIGALRFYDYTPKMDAEYLFHNYATSEDYIPKSVTDAKTAYEEALAAVSGADPYAGYKKIYKSFWNVTACPDDPQDELPINWSDTTFTVPNNIVIFTGDKILYNKRLGTVLSFLESHGEKPADYYKAVNGRLGNSNIFIGESNLTGKPGTEYYDKLLTEFNRDYIISGKNNLEALAHIKAWIDACMDAVEAARTVVDDAAFTAEKADWTTKKKAYDEYPDKKAAWDAYQAALAALKEAFYGVKKYDKNGKPVEYFSTDVPTIPAPVPGAIPATYESVDPIIKNWAYNTKYFGGKQLELAQKWHGDYPETLHGFYDRAYHITHITDHLDAIMAALDAAYTAATGIYQYEWEKYVIVVDPVTHEYKINITAVKKDYGENLAADLATFFDNYNKFQRRYRTAWETYLEKCEIELGYWKKLLAQFNAGYNPIEMAVKEQQNIIAQLEIKVETAKKRLELAEAEYNATIAKLLN